MAKCGKACCVLGNIILIGALSYGGYYLYKKHTCAQEEKKEATEGLVEEIPAEAAPEEKPAEEKPAEEAPVTESA